MLKGYNSDVKYEGKRVHIQTEDWGPNNPFIVTRIFEGGTVLKSIKTSYKEVLPENFQESSLKIALKTQHGKILDLLLSGHII